MAVTSSQEAMVSRGVFSPLVFLLVLDSSTVKTFTCIPLSIGTLDCRGCFPVAGYRFPQSVGTRSRKHVAQAHLKRRCARYNL